VLDACVFETVEQVREITETWLSEYNEERPHDISPPRQQKPVNPDAAVSYIFIRRA
jgi:hypothetical protein